ncbi:MAG: hypothetical protein ACI9LE_000472 [Paraglaciecola sp.]|jgi:hypothetical protein
MNVFRRLNKRKKKTKDVDQNVFDVLNKYCAQHHGDNAIYNHPSCKDKEAKKNIVDVQGWNSKQANYRFFWCARSSKILLKVAITNISKPLSYVTRQLQQLGGHGMNFCQRITTYEARWLCLIFTTRQ